jgi:hypothetical protein
LGCRYKSAPPYHFSSQLAPPPLELAISPWLWLRADSYFLDSGVVYLAQCFLAHLGCALNIVACTPYCQVSPPVARSL